MAEMTYRTVNIKTANINMELVRGYAEPAEVRGDDDVIPGASGRREQSRQKDRLILRLEGWVKGTGTTLLDRQKSWRTNTDALLALMDFTLASGNLVISDNYLGLADATTKTISCKCINYVPGPIQAAGTLQRWSFDLECVASPPVWT